MDKQTPHHLVHTKHWHYVYRRRRKRKGISAKEIVIGQIIALSGSLVAGFLLELNKETVALFAGALLLLPGVIDLAASITGAMCAKINHKLQDGHRPAAVISSSVVFALLMSVTAGLVVGITGGLIGKLLFDASFLSICVLAIATMISVGIIAYPLMALLTQFIRKRGADPDNIIGPVETGFTDMLTVITVVLLVRLFS